MRDSSDVGQEPGPTLGLLSGKEAAAKLGVTTRALAAMRRRGWILSVEQANGQYAYPASEVERLVRSGENPNPT